MASWALTLFAAILANVSDEAPTWLHVALGVAAMLLAAWLLALVGIWASLAAHAGAHEHIELPPVLHLLRDGSLAVPLAAAALALCGCKVGPNYQRPETAAPPEWSETPPPAAGITTAHEGATHAADVELIYRAAEGGANLIDVVAAGMASNENVTESVLSKTRELAKAVRHARDAEPAV